MTREEHRLMIGMLANQLALIAELYATLEEKGVLTADDEEAIQKRHSLSDLRRSDSASRSQSRTKQWRKVSG